MAMKRDINYLEPSLYKNSAKKIPESTFNSDLTSLIYEIYQKYGPHVLEVNNQIRKKTQ